MKGFYHIWAWRPSWSCDPDAANKISFPLPKEAPHKIWLRSDQRFRRRSLSIVDDADGSGELIIRCTRTRSTRRRTREKITTRTSTIQKTTTRKRRAQTRGTKTGSSHNKKKKKSSNKKNKNSQFKNSAVPGLFILFTFKQNKNKK